MTERQREEKINIAKKFNYILDNYISANEAQKAFGYNSPSYLTRLRDPRHTSTLNTLHIQLLEYVFEIPKKIFNKTIDFDTNNIDTLIKEFYVKNKKSQKNRTQLEKSQIFSDNKKLFEALKGIWYAYMYPSNPSSSKEDDGVWIVETTINEDYSVIDEYKNAGVLQISTHQSLILKKSDDHDDLTVIRFQNRQVFYGIFRFVIMSTQNGSENEMVNFGFYSREKYTPDVAKKILGDINRVQMKLCLEFNDRINQQITIK